RIIDAGDPRAAALCPFLIDQKLIVILDEEFRRVTRLLFGVSQRTPGQNKIAGKQRRAAFADKPLADDDSLDAFAVQVERGVATSRAAAYDDNLRSEESHAETAPNRPKSKILCDRLHRGGGPIST